MLRQHFFRAVTHPSTSLNCRCRSDFGVVARHQRPPNSNLTGYRQRLTKNRCSGPSPAELGCSEQGIEETDLFLGIECTISLEGAEALLIDMLPPQISS